MSESTLNSLIFQQRLRLLKQWKYFKNSMSTPSEDTIDDMCFTLRNYLELINYKKTHYLNNH